jgi:hypothetical protein
MKIVWKGKAMQRALTDNDIKEMNANESLAPDRRKGDRRKAMNSYVDPKMERRKGDTKWTQ